ncbi:MAG: DUF262 domain-containing protein [Erysipelotrichales bacterium]|nr:DUF262 domain-containing protein [Erysipelotrichales bacterium]
MPNGFQQPITIKEAMDNIHSRKYLLPAIQREFVWESEQIEILFDSILRDYPINSFMAWKISSDELKSSYKFYEFLKEFREGFKKENPLISTTGVQDFDAIVDGQQRLTSLYIGLHGSYAYKLPRKWWIDNEENIPTRHLFLNLTSKISSEIDNSKEYDFRFLTKRKKSFLDEKGTFWFRMTDIINLSTLSSVMSYLKTNHLDENDFASETLSKLYQKIHNDKLINMYIHEDNDPDKILEIFLRTNSGGTPLTFSDLLMSISSANWKNIDARVELNKLVTEINKLGTPGFRITRDFILKTCLVIFSEDIRFKLKNFGVSMVETFELYWEKIRKSIVSAFTVFVELGFNDTNFRAKNAAIPVIYYIYSHDISDEIVKSTYDINVKKSIRKWLTLSFIRSIFGGQTDQVLTKMRNVIREMKMVDGFPINELINAFSSDPARNYQFDDEFINNLLYLEYGTTECDYILYLLYPDRVSQNIHRDHMHPKSFFEKKENVCSIINENSRLYASDARYWNTLLNLQLLDSTQNTHKQDKSLEEWVVEQKITISDLFIDDNISLSTEFFYDFINSRKNKISSLLKTIK